MNTKKLGTLGEAVACAYLQKKGFILHAHQYRSGSLELDLVMQEAEVLVFVEVKTRKKFAFGLPEESVSTAKQKHLIAAAEAYLYQHFEEPPPCRFDVVTVIPDGKSYQIKHFQNAFWVE